MDALTQRDLKTHRDLYLSDEGRGVELDADGLPVPFELDTVAAQRVRDWLDGWLTKSGGPQGSLLAEAAVAPAAVEELADPEERGMLPFARESDLSRLAALQAYPKQGTQRRRIISELAEQMRGMTRDELAAALELSPNTIRPRVVELISGGWLRESDLTRPSNAGQPSAVLVLTERATEAVRLGG